MTTHLTAYCGDQSPGCPENALNRIMKFKPGSTGSRKPQLPEPLGRI